MEFDYQRHLWKPFGAVYFLVFVCFCTLKKDSWHGSAADVFPVPLEETLPLSLAI